MLTRLYRRLASQHGREECYYVDFADMPEKHELALVSWLIGGWTEDIRHESFLTGSVVEVGPRLSVETPFSSNAVAICQSMNLDVRRIEKSTRYVADQVELIKMDPLTQEIYAEPLTRFDLGQKPEPVRTVAVLEEGESALAQANLRLGLGMDASDIAYYTDLFRGLGRNPTDVELMQIGNGNSEHSRHHFFRGIQVIDGVEMSSSLMDIVKRPWKARTGNSLVAFHDNSGVAFGTNVNVLIPDYAGMPAKFRFVNELVHRTATAETHNHPTLIAPFPGAETGAGGRIRDSRAVGRGGLTHAGLAGYAVGNLHIPGHHIPGEQIGGEQVATHASPLEILLRGSDGVSDYGNKIGEPLIAGFTRSFGQMVDGVRREFRKPVLYSAGVGRLLDEHLAKHKPEEGMCIVRIGGPAYRIGVGGGSASSMMQGTNAAELDLKSVQRGDPEMENRVNRVIQACAEMRDQNPIESIHDQGAGGPSNVLTELMEPAGGRIDIRRIKLGDQTMSVLEIWVAEYQEGYGLLIRPDNLPALERICQRERVNCEVLGEITGDRSVVVEDSSDGTTPVNLALAHILEDVPRKRFSSERKTPKLVPLADMSHVPIPKLVEAVFLLPQVGSKGFLVRKVDRSVTGLVARQQCCGPMQVPVANAAVTADGYLGLTGVAVALGEQPIKMLANPAAGARMAVAEMVTNLASVKISSLRDVTCRANWMWAAKLPHEGANLCDAAVAMSDMMVELEIAIDGGKDSLSMATKVGGTQVVSPGELVVFGYAPVTDVTRVATPDFKGNGSVFLIDLGRGKNRLGGSSLAQVTDTIGDESPDIEDVAYLKRAFDAVQRLIEEGHLSAYHDRSDGGLVTALAEMCIAGSCGAYLRLPTGGVPISLLFAEEAGMVLEVPAASHDAALGILRTFEVSPIYLGTTDAAAAYLSIAHQGSVVLHEPIALLRTWWEATSTALEKSHATNPETVRQEAASFMHAKAVDYHLSFTPNRPSPARSRPQVAVVREEGTNGDREMAAALHTAGFDVWDITMSDILSERVTTLDNFQGVVFPGGFSYGDVFGSARGWAAPILYTKKARDLFNRFYDRKDTFSLGVCNGFQLMATIGWLPKRNLKTASWPQLLHNTSGRFESRWSAVKVLPSPSILLRGMEGSILGVHVAHGEGRLVIPDSELEAKIWTDRLAPLAYVNQDGEETEQYPYNPNGSPNGWTALCSPDGRHLGMMPHPERCFLTWQWPWMPEEWRKSLSASPWLQMFLNARDWCLGA